MSAVSRLFSGSEHGILLWWSAGFGPAVQEAIEICEKTWTKLSTGTRIILICPAHLKTQWMQLVRKAGARPGLVKLMNFSNFLRQDSFAGHVVIIDQAHNILDLDNQSTVKAVKLLNGSRKVILMTKTPMYSAITDLTILVNIAAGREVVPYNHANFVQRYYGINGPRSLFYGQYFAAANAASSLVLLSSIVVNVNRGSVRKYLILEAERSLNDDARFLAFLKSVVNSTIGDHFIKNKTSLNLGSKVGEGLGEDKKILALFKDSAINQPSSNFMEFVFFYAKHVIMMNPNLMNSMTNVFFVSYIFLVIMVLMYYILLIVDFFAGISSDLPRFKKFRTDLFAKDIYKFVDYSFTQSKYSYSEIKVPYSDHQMDVWIKLTQEIAGPDIIRDLDMSKNFKYESAKISAEQYLNNGIFVGNLPDSAGGPRSSSVQANSVQANSVQAEGARPSPKFLEIIKVLKGKRAAVYSNSVNAGLQLFRDFLESRKVQCLVLSPDTNYTDRIKILDKFSAETECVLLVHPDMTEGYSVRGAQQLHILEPIRDVSRRFQLISLFSESSGLAVYQWISSNSSAMSKIMRLFYSAKNWLKYKSEVLYFVDFNKFSQFQTPDEIVSASVKQISEDIKGVKTYMDKNINKNINKNIGKRQNRKTL